MFTPEHFRAKAAEYAERVKGSTVADEKRGYMERQVSLIPRPLDTSRVEVWLRRPWPFSGTVNEGHASSKK